MRNRLPRAMAAMLLGLPLITSAMAAPADYPARKSFPHEDRAAVAEHLRAARQLAGTDLLGEFRWRCLTSPFDPVLVAGVQHEGLVQPSRLFDQLYSVGQNAVSAHILRTDQGLILIDALNDEAEAREILEPNMKALGLDPAQIRYVIITHGHGDHYGGAKYFQDRYGARIVSTETDWAMMANPPVVHPRFAHIQPPRKDIVAQDGDVIRLGSTEVRLHVTPGHTPGTLSLIFPVTHEGERHMVGLMGGAGGGRDRAGILAQNASLERWREITSAAGVDTAIGNHPVHSYETEAQEILRYARPGDPHPLVLGQERYRRLVGVLLECSQVQLARMGPAAQNGGTVK